jgi:DNA-binding MarR family transcriptional regulator
MSQDNYLEYNPDCLYTEKLAFKLFVMASLLADNNLAYRGTLKDISKELGFAGTADTRRNKRIKDAINQLEEKGLIKVLKDGNIYTISQAKRADKKAIRIARDTVKLIRTTLMEERTGHDWSYTLKVLLYLIETDNTFVEGMNDRFYKEIAEALDINKKQVGFAIKQLEERFQAISTNKNYRVETNRKGDLLIKREATTIHLMPIVKE